MVAGKERNEEEERRRNRKSAYGILIGAAVGLTLANIWAKNVSALEYMIIVNGIVVFFATLMFTNYVSKSEAVDKGEIRKSIAAAMLVVFFTILATEVSLGPDPILIKKCSTLIEDVLHDTNITDSTVLGKCMEIMQNVRVPSEVYRSLIGVLTGAIMALLGFYFGYRAAGAGQTPTLTPTPPKITSTANESGTVNQPYKYDNNDAAEASGTSPITWSLVRGPQNFQIDSTTGKITWTPTKAGDEEIEIKATNSAGSDTQKWTVKV